MDEYHNHTFTIPRTGRERRRVKWIVFLSFVSFIFAVVSIAHCSFLLVSSSNRLLRRSTTTRRNLQNLGYGLFGFEDHDDRCVPWNEDSDSSEEYFDVTFKAARAFGVMTAVLTGILFLSMCSLTMIPCGDSDSRYVVWLLGATISCRLALVTEIFTIVLTRASSVGYFGPMGYLAILNAIFLLVVAILIYKTPHDIMTCSVHPVTMGKIDVLKEESFSA